MKLTYRNMGIRLLGKEDGLSKEYEFQQGVPQDVVEKDAKIILEKTIDEFDTDESGAKESSK